MRIAALYDIHGNLPALEAVLHDVRAAGVDQIVIGGDVFPGPMPRECLHCLMDVDIPIQFIHGNGELDVLSSLAGRPIPHVPERFREVVAWVADQVHADQSVLARWSRTVTVEVPEIGQVLFCHATAESATQIFTRETPPDRVAALFGELASGVVICGHTHMQFDRQVERLRIMNAGSVGMPFGEPGADWMLVGPTIEFRHTEYDLAAAAVRIEATDYPQAREFASRHVLNPPSEHEMLAIYSRADEL